MKLAWTILGMLGGTMAMAQCVPSVTTYPYEEGFETAPQWTVGGTASDWAWGTPAHPLINSAGGGTRSWCVGGLTGTYYNAGQLSWLESPCFDLTSLQHPWVSFKIFWETERQYDGLVFQYSTDGGTTYHNLGAYGDEEDCLNRNWFNTSNISNLTSASPRHGWSGRLGATSGSCMGGLGSGEWVEAAHCMAQLVGEPTVRFRFLFGAGTQCNNYDGIAIDDIHIGEAPPNTVQLISDCIDGSTVSFATVGLLCPTARVWDFGDPASGAANQSFVEFPQHTFSGPGTYTVTVVVSGPCNALATASIEVVVLGITPTITDPACGLDNGAVLLTEQNGVSPLQCLWQPGGPGGPSMADLAAGSYTVLVEAPNACPVEVELALVDQGTSVLLQAVVEQVDCPGSEDGSVQLSAELGVAPYLFHWDGQPLTGTLVEDLAPGTYQAVVEDASGCTDTLEVEVTGPAELTVQPGADQTMCAGDQVVLTASATGGTSPYTYQWSPEGPTVGPGEDATYTVVVTDANGCLSVPEAVSVQVVELPVFEVLVDTEEGCAPVCARFMLSPAPEQAVWSFSDGATAQGTAVERCVDQTGWLSVEVQAANAGCGAVHQQDSLLLVMASPVARLDLSQQVVTTDAPLIQAWDASVGAERWRWSVGLPVLFSDSLPFVQFVLDSIGCFPVQLTVSNAQGCSDTTVDEVCVEAPFALYVPNAFTPDGDGLNDRVHPICTVRDPKEYRWLIMDRWGRPVFDSTDPTAAWDGGSRVQGVYVWKLWVRDSTGRRHEAIGHLTLLP